MSNTHLFPRAESLQSAIHSLEQRINQLSGNEAPVVALTIACQKLIKLGAIANRNWPVAVDESLAQQFVENLNAAGNALQRHLNSPTWRQNAVGIAREMEGFALDIQDTKQRILCGSPEEYRQELESLSGLRDHLNSSIESLNSIATDRSNEHTIKQQSNYFVEQAGKFWLIAGVSLLAFVGLSVFFAFRLYHFHALGNVLSLYSHELSATGNEAIGIQRTCPDCLRTYFINALIKSNALRIVEVSFLLFLIAVALKAFNSAAHNYTVNMQRSNSLRAALQLLEKSHSNEAKDAMMDKAAAAIFSHQPTGYNQKPPANLLQNVLEFGKGQGDA
ncbi:MAG: hypothetical protein H6592_15080 [Flavobacteriales bacterium]|nr:hypothetical protein [Flavobacteriales bacterium]